MFASNVNLAELCARDFPTTDGTVKCLKFSPFSVKERIRISTKTPTRGNNETSKQHEFRLDRPGGGLAVLGSNCEVVTSPLRRVLNSGFLTPREPWFRLGYIYQSVSQSESRKGSIEPQRFIESPKGCSFRRNNAIRSTRKDSRPSL
ncbi:hypothetical protein KM043_005011 [Ampulex compressa]|nr:hypothetical protein KM043_005011 [Ampulex compressa]